MLYWNRRKKIGSAEFDDGMIMEQYQVRLSAYQEGDRVVITVKLDDAEMIMKYSNKDSIAVIAENLDRILEYMWQDYLVRKEFNGQLENELEDWLRDGN